MIKYPLAILIALLLILALAAPIYAFTPPGQGTDNATDVILWGDNVTLTVGVPGGLTVAGDVEIDLLQDSLANLLAFIIVGSITAFVVLRKSNFGKSIASILLLVYGLRMAIPEDLWSVLWMAGVIIAMVGTGLIFGVVLEAIGKSKNKEAQP